MRTFRATCPACGDLDLLAEDLRLQICETLTGPVMSFEFQCWGCEAKVAGPANAELARTLQFAGVAVHVTRLPDEARETHAGPPLTDDDVIGFGRWLERAECPLTELVHV